MSSDYSDFLNLVVFEKSDDKGDVHYCTNTMSGYISSLTIMVENSRGFLVRTNDSFISSENDILGVHHHYG